MTKIRPELTLLWSYGDAALSHVSPGEPWGEGGCPIQVLGGAQFKS
jgi:hypothetical protein